MSADIAIKCDILEMMVAESEARTSALPTFGYEAPEAALNLMKVASKHVIGVTLARTDFNLLPSAEVAARAAYEASVRAAWMLAPPTHFEREARCATHLRGEVDYLEKEIREGKEVMGIDMTGTEQRRDAIGNFTTACQSSSKNAVTRQLDACLVGQRCCRILANLRVTRFIPCCVRPRTVVTTAPGYSEVTVLEH